MALKGDRITAYPGAEDISNFMNVTAEAGTFVTYKTSGSGSSLDDATSVVEIPTGGVSGTRPAGLLLCDVVNYDLTRQHLNQHKNEVQVSGKVQLLRHGVVVTDSITSGQSPSAGQPAYYTSLGELTPAVVANGTVVGRFMSAKDENGYAKVEINIV